LAFKNKLHARAHVRCGRPPGVSSPLMSVRQAKPASHRKALATGAVAAYSPTIEFEFTAPTTADTKEHTMNTTNSFPQASRTSTLASLSLAAVLTVAMLFSVNALATSDVAPQQMVQAHSAAA
jgi:hypothetical protein